MDAESFALDGLCTRCAVDGNCPDHDFGQRAEAQRTYLDRLKSFDAVVARQEQHRQAKATKALSVKERRKVKQNKGRQKRFKDKGAVRAIH